MKVISLILKLIVLAVLLFFALQNTTPVTFTWGFAGNDVQWPLIVLLFIAFVLGVIFGMLALLGRILSLRASNTKLEREIKKLQKTADNDAKETVAKVTDAHATNAQKA